MSREDPQLKLRLPEELKQRVVEAARRNNRSVNAEIVNLLEDAFITEVFAEKMERLSVERADQRSAAQAKSINSRLSEIEAKLDQLLAFEDHYREQAEHSKSKPSVVVRNEKPLSARRQKDEE
ncbi:Arc family DNA-binding protein [Ciceribacter sp. RN22]|uniref:Arc family DNA-binding protein n=1 Tax=Ciceribacter sp. RN22 TaxID=2954932 RepID=UPI0020932110|nr:Arc family DNA-binding protein [Ciceribacter sp. RN22]MCO6180271.1 Arc family DNA-binding protein [Ciceribacter sp. RN22]